jgi:Clp amino terminal domain, pathogenicity island component
MFERFTEPARRSLFFARYEASLLGSAAIETHHLLLGLLKDPDSLITRLLAGTPIHALRQLIYARAGEGTSPIGLSVEIPFSRNVKHVLQYALEEAERLLQNPIGPEHLLLGLLRLEEGLAWDILSESHIALAPVREALVMLVSATTEPPPEILKMLAGLVPNEGPRVRRTGNMYFLKALDGSHSGRRLVVDYPTAGAFASFVEFNTAADSPPDGRIQSIGPLSMQGVTLPQFALVLEAFLETPVIVDGDLPASERYDIELHGAYNNADTLIPALQEQLGLELIRSD